MKTRPEYATFKFMICLLVLINLSVITAGVMFWVTTMIMTGGMPQFAIQPDTQMGVLYSPTKWRPATREGGKIIYRPDTEAE